MSDRDKIREALSGVEPLKVEGIDRDKFQNVSVGNYDPPSYIVQILFLNVLGCADFGSEEKVWWHTYFRFKGHTFLIRDYKFGTWSIEVNNTDNETNRIVDELKGRIRHASHFVDRVLYELLKNEVEQECFFLQNHYSTLSSLYMFLEAKTKDAIGQYDAPEDSSATQNNTSDIMNFLNRQLELDRNVSFYVLPLNIVFYSMLEFLMDVFYAFERPSIAFFDFRELKWSERFKKVLPVQTDFQIAKVYRELLHIRRHYRNPLCHGLTDETSLLVPMPGAGIVPLSYKNLSLQMQYGLTPISKDTATYQLDIFTRFNEYIEEREPFCMYLLFAQHAFPIPIEETAAQEVKRHMTGYDNFDEYLVYRSMHEDMIINRDI